MDGCVPAQEMLADTAKRPKEIAQTRPHAFGRIGVDFKHMVLIIVACPFLDTMSNAGMLALNALIGFVIIRENMAIGLSETMHMIDQCFDLGGVNHLQTNLAARTTNGAQHRRTIISIGASSTALVGFRQGCVTMPAGCGNGFAASLQACWHIPTALQQISHNQFIW